MKDLVEVQIEEPHEDRIDDGFRVSLRDPKNREGGVLRAHGIDLEGKGWNIALTQDGIFSITNNPVLVKKGITFPTYSACVLKLEENGEVITLTPTRKKLNFVAY